MFVYSRTSHRGKKPCVGNNFHTLWVCCFEYFRKALNISERQYIYKVVLGPPRWDYSLVQKIYTQKSLGFFSYFLTKTRLCHVHPTVKSLNHNMNHHWCFNIGNIIVIDVAFTLWNCGGGDWSHRIHSAASPPTGVKVRTTTRTTHFSWCIHNLCSVCFTTFSKSFHYKQHHTSSKIDLTRLSPSSMKQGNRMSLEGKYDT